MVAAGLCACRKVSLANPDPDEFMSCTPKAFCGIAQACRASGYPGQALDQHQITYDERYIWD